MIVFTRADLADPQPIQEQVRHINPRAACFHCRTRLRGLVEVSTGRNYPLGAFEGEPVVAFCGVGNPRAFFADVRKWGFIVAAEYSFRDHHVYSGEDLLPLILDVRKSGARALVTTEKDAINLTSFKRGGPLILACVTEAVLEEAEAFEAGLLSRLAATKQED